MATPPFPINFGTTNGSFGFDPRTIGSAAAAYVPKVDEEQRRKQLLSEQAAKAGGFADYGEGGVISLAGQSDTARQNLADIASGKLSYSKEDLRQSLMRNQAAQRSMAASAAPQNQAMAARTAAIQSARLGSGMAGNAALAGIAERQGAAKLYSDATLQQRQQDMMAALQSRQNAMNGYSPQMQGPPEKGWFEKYGPALIGGVGALLGGPAGAGAGAAWANGQGSLYGMGKP
jgi:hypothetical protein